MVGRRTIGAVVRLSCRKAHVEEEDGQFERKITLSKKKKVNPTDFSF
jgi:hypothetical protein